MILFSSRDHIFIEHILCSHNTDMEIKSHTLPDQKSNKSTEKKISKIEYGKH